MGTGHYLSVFVLGISVLAAGCTPATITAGAAPTAIMTSPSPTVAAPATNVPLSFKPAVYRAETRGFELDYPADWTAVPIGVIGSRGSFGQVFSPGGTAEKLAAGGSRVNITVYDWDPKSDLAAYVTHRRSNWDPAGGQQVPQESAGDLADGSKYSSFVVQGSDGQQSYFLFTTLGQQYLEISGEGNLALVEEIAHTLRHVQ